MTYITSTLVWLYQRCHTHWEHHTWPMSAVFISTLSSYVLYDSNTHGISNRAAGNESLPILNEPDLPSSAIINI